jgi:hypothetical protein
MHPVKATDVFVDSGGSMLIAHLDLDC